MYELRRMDPDAAGGAPTPTAALQRVFALVRAGCPAGGGPRAGETGWLAVHWSARWPWPNPSVALGYPFGMEAFLETSFRIITAKFLELLQNSSGVKANLKM